MPAPHITSMQSPVPCAVCGRPTTRFNRLSGVADCGRDDPSSAIAVDGFGPPLRGEHHGRWRGRRRLGRTPAA